MPTKTTVFLTLLPDDGEPVGRGVLRDAICQQLNEDVPDGEVDEIIHSLALQRKVEWIEESRQVRLVLPGQQPELPSVILMEKDIEPWFERYLWLHPSMFFDPVPQGLKLMVQNTARITAGAGRWSRPDICMATVVRYKYQPGSQISIYTFELKMPSGVETRSVFEALAHTASGHYPFLVLYLPEGSPETSRLEGVLDQAQRHGVGIIRMTDPRDPGTYRRLLDARRFEPAQSAIDSLIDERFDRANRLALYRWVRT